LLCIIADDLTGALDAAAPFAGRGLSVVVALHPDAMEGALSKGSDVVAVSTQSREVSQELAAERVAAVAGVLPAGTRVFKKVDSRLKGHVAAELAALSPASLLVAPAIPEFGRVVRAGAVCGFGVDSAIPVAARLGVLAARAHLPDTASASDMQAALAKAPLDALLVGARGLAEALAIQMTARTTAVAPRPRAERALMVVGSRDPITLAQVAELQARGADLRGAPNGQMDDRRPLAKLTVVQALPGTTKVSGDDVAQALATSVHPLLTDAADAIFLTGGATAEAVMRAMSLQLLWLEGEILPGIPLAWEFDPATGGSGIGRRRAVILKSGGFGGEDTLIRLADILTGGR
jgi:uncharacterized protein YgbK (DUF1537 family)